MAEDTRRDRVWSTVLEALADGIDHDLPEPNAEGHIPDGIIKSDITPRVEASGRTVHDVLRTMTEYGYLESETQRVYVPTPTGHEIQETTVYTAVPDGPFGAFTATEPIADTDTVEATDPASEPEPTTTDDEPRYVIGCPECEFRTTRKQDSAVVKGVRRRKRVCPKCEAILKLLKDDRPDPPVCPECGEEVIDKMEHDEGVRYVHAYEVLGTGMGKLREAETCFVA
jgi:DNA-directed RNA polymerase subunit RPC12/RpoP